MLVSVYLSSEEKGELNRFLSLYYNTNFEIEDSFHWEKEYANPIELAEIVGTFIDNCEDFHLHMWVSLDKNIFLPISEKNANDVIKYLYERFPY